MRSRLVTGRQNGQSIGWFLPLSANAASKKFAEWQNANEVRITGLEESYRLEELIHQTGRLSDGLQLEIYANVWDEARTTFEELHELKPETRSPRAAKRSRTSRDDEERQKEKWKEQKKR